MREYSKFLQQGLFNGFKLVCLSCRTHREDNFLAVKHGNYTVDMDEIMGEALDWTMQYLQYM